MVRRKDAAWKEVLAASDEDEIWRGNYFKGEPIGRVEVRVGKLKNRKAASGDEVTGEMVKIWDYLVIDWIYMFCNMAFESVVVPEDWRCTLILPFWNGKRQEL